MSINHLYPRYAVNMDAVTDRFDRPLRDLRISVTDRCNFRCVYCMPKEVFGHDFEFMRRSQLLSFEEITRLARVFAGAGVRKLRLTGGEPLLRRDIESLIAMLAEIDGIDDIALTTNGSLLARKAQGLRDAGLPFVTQAAMAKYFASQVAERVASRAVEVFGGVGFTKDYPVEKLYRDAKIGRIYEGTSNMQRLTIAKGILG